MMLPRGLRYYVILVLVLAGAVLYPSSGRAQSLADYAASPPTVGSAVRPNILIIFDNSGSMQILAHANSNTFSNSNTYTGVFEPEECYQYVSAGAGVFRGDPAANPATPSVCSNASYPWSGNLLNFVGMRRIDIAKQALIGGNCDTARDGEDKCATIVKAQDANFTTKGNKQATVDTSSSPLTNLLPSSYLSNMSGSNLYFHHAGASVTALAGYICVDDDSGYPTDVNCTDDTSDSHVDQGPLRLAVEVTTPSGGVLQEVGDKARFAVMKYAHGNDGGPLTVDMGTDMTAIIDYFNFLLPPGGTGTPLPEMLYEAARYYANIVPPYDTTYYDYTDQTKDPYYFNAPQWIRTSDHVPCCQSYVLMFTDGETNSQDIPAALEDSYTADGNHEDDVAYWFHTNDMRQGTIPVINESGKDLPGFQNLTLYTFFAFGSGSVRLQNASKAGGFEDIGCDPADPVTTGCNVPDKTAEWDKIDNLTGAATPDGVPDNYFESDDANFLKDRMLAAIVRMLERSASGSSTAVLGSSSTGSGATYQTFFFPRTIESLRSVKWTGYMRSLFIDEFGNLREDSGPGGNPDGRLIFKDDKILKMTFNATTNKVDVERFVDSDEDGKADTPNSPSGAPLDLRQVKGIFEAGEQLALTSSSARNLLTWVDKDGDGVVDVGEQIKFRDTAAELTSLTPYLNPGNAPYTAQNIINFVRGDQVAGLRDRELTVGGSPNVWKLGDTVHASPVVVGAPAQRYDVIYGDGSYTEFFGDYHDRRLVVYLGANDGMLHAFNGGYFHPGDDPGSPDTEHGYFTETPSGAGSGKALGEELFGFIPQELLPHLRWLTQPDYSHVYYVDMTPKVTDVRIFCATGGPASPNCFPGQAGVTHTKGWGTILIGGFRLGGSCGNCTAGGGAPRMDVLGDFDENPGTPDTPRTFYSAYFVLDITDPDQDPQLLFSFSSNDLGLTTSIPSVLRVNPASSAMTDHANAKWFMVVGSGPTGYDGRSAQDGMMYAIDLALGPGTGNANVVTMTAETDVNHAFMGDTLTIDRNFDYRVDVTYLGSVIDDSPRRGKLYRLTMNSCAAPCTPSVWGIDPDTDGVPEPTELLEKLPPSGSNEFGPVASRPSVAIDDANNLWVFAGTGLYYSAADRNSTDTRYFAGVKDSVLNNGCTETTRTGCKLSDLVDVSNAKVCVIGVGDCGISGGTNQVQNVAGATDIPSLIALVAGKEGWFTSLPNTGERVLFRSLVIAGLVIFTTFAPEDDICSSSGESRLYVLHYLTGGPPREPVIGTSNDGTNDYVERSTSLGEGVASQAVVHIGSGGGVGRATTYVQTSTGALKGIEVETGKALTSRFLTWYDRHG